MYLPNIFGRVLAIISGYDLPLLNRIPAEAVDGTTSGCDCRCIPTHMMLSINKCEEHGPCQNN